MVFEEKRNIVRLTLLFLTFAALAGLTNGCANLEGTGAIAFAVIPEGTSIFVKERDVDILEWPSKVRKQLGDAGYNVLDSEGGEGTYVLVYDYQAAWDV